MRLSLEWTLQPMGSDPNNVTFCVPKAQMLPYSTAPRSFHSVNWQVMANKLGLAMKLSALFPPFPSLPFLGPGKGMLPLILGTAGLCLYKGFC